MTIGQLNGDVPGCIADADSIRQSDYTEDVAFWQRRTSGTFNQEDVRQGVENVAGFFDVLARWTSPDLPAPLALPELPDLEVAA